MVDLFHITYIIFIAILVLGVLYLYWIDDDISLPKTSGESEEETLSSSWLPLHKLIEDDQSYSSEEIGDEKGPIEKFKSNLNRNWLCKLENKGKKIELVKPIEPFTSSQGSQFAPLN